MNQVEVLSPFAKPEWLDNPCSYCGAKEGEKCQATIKPLRRAYFEAGYVHNVRYPK